MSAITKLAEELRDILKWERARMGMVSAASLKHVIAELDSMVELSGPTPPFTWNDPAHYMPDADESVLVWITHDPYPAEWDSGWFDGEHWRLCESGGVIDGRVLCWTRPVVPNAELSGPQRPARKVEDGTE